MPYLSEPNREASCFEQEGDEIGPFENPHEWEALSQPVDGWDTRCAQCGMYARSVPVRHVIDMYDEMYGNGPNPQ